MSELKQLLASRIRDARDKYGISYDDIIEGMRCSGSDDPDFGARYSLAASLAVNIRGGEDARHEWNMRRAASYGR